MRKSAFRWPATHIQTDFGEDPFELSANRVRVIWSGPPRSFAPGDDAGLPPAAFRRNATGSNRRRHSHFRFKSCKGLFGLLIALHDFELIAVVKFQRCCTA